MSDRAAHRRDRNRGALGSWRSWLLLLTLMLVSWLGLGCGGAPRTVVVEWGGAHMTWGSASLLVHSDGTVRFITRPTGMWTEGEEALDVSIQLTPDELESLHQVLATHRLCELPWQNEPVPGELLAPDEGTDRITVAFRDLSCTVARPESLWRQEPDAAAIERVIQALILRAQQRAGEQRSR